MSRVEEKNAEEAQSVSTIRQFTAHPSEQNSKTSVQADATAASTSPHAASQTQFDFPWKLKPEERYPPPNPEKFTEFEKKYPPDHFGEEASRNARVWRMYRDRVTDLDEDLLQGWHETLNVLLIFAGLFSAIATAFVIEGSKQLQHDYTEYTARGVIALLAQLDNTVVPPGPLPNFNSFSASTRSQWVNGLWFASLTLALIDALLAILAKQWLVEYASKMRRPVADARRWAWRHHAFNQGLSKWGVGVFISSLAVLLHVSLYLFLFGLLTYLFELDAKVCAAAVVLTVAASAFHIIATIAPLWFGDCPTTTPFLAHLRSTFLSAKWIFARCYEEARMVARRCMQGYRSSSWRIDAEEPRTPLDAMFSTLPAYDGERLIDSDYPARDCRALIWMVDNLLIDEDVGVALQAIGALHLDDHEEYNWEGINPLRSDSLTSSVDRIGTSIIVFGVKPVWPDGDTMPAQLAALLRTWLFTRTPVWPVLSASLLSLGLLPSHDLHILSHMLQDRAASGSNSNNTANLHSGLLRHLRPWYLSESLSQKHPMEPATRRILLWDVASAVAASPTSSCQRLEISDLVVLTYLAIDGSISIAAIRRVDAILYAWLSANKQDQGLAVQFHKYCGALLGIDQTGPYASVLSVWSVMLLSSEALQLPAELVSACQRIYFEILSHQGSFVNDSLPLSVEILEAALAWIPCAPLLNPEAIDNVGIMIFDSLARSDHRYNFWSSKLDDIVRSLLQVKTLTPSFSINALFYWLAVDLNPHAGLVEKAHKYTTTESLLQESAITMLRCRQNEGDRIFSTWDLACDQLLSTGGPACGASNFSTNLTRPAYMFSVELALLSHQALRTWVGPDTSLGELLDNLAGGDRGIQLALADTNGFVDLARHGRVVSEAWWQDTRARLLGLSDERWAQRHPEDDHASSQDLVTEVEDDGECKECARTALQLKEVVFAHDVAETDTIQSSRSTGGHTPTHLDMWTRLGTQLRSSVRLTSSRQQSVDVEMQSRGDGRMTD